MSRRGRVPTQTRDAQHPTFLGEFEQLSLRVLKGQLKQFHRLIGYSDTAFNSNGGFGGGGYNAWYQIDLKEPAWVIITKGGQFPNFIQTSVFDQNVNPQEGRMIFQRDQPPVEQVQFLSANVFPNQPKRGQSPAQRDALRFFGDQLNPNNTFNYYPFFGHVTQSNADLYNTFDRHRLDKGDEMYYPLNRGRYLICISSTRNEPLDFEVGIVVEPKETEVFILCEDVLVVNLALENELEIPTNIEIDSPVTQNITVASGQNAFTEILCDIQNPRTVTVEAPSTWLISTTQGTDADQGLFLGEFTEGYLDTFHDHSFDTWQTAWRRDNRPNDALPDLFIPLLNRR